jgi:hypothetical protein
MSTLQRASTLAMIFTASAWAPAGVSRGSVIPGAQAVSAESSKFDFLGIMAARTQAPGDACALLSREDAAEALGEAAEGPEANGPISDGMGSTLWACEYSGSGVHSIQLTLRRFPPSALAMYTAMCAQQGNEGLTGLGDVACWYDAAHAELNVIEGTALVSIELRRSGDPTGPIKAAMSKALARLR